MLRNTYTIFWKETLVYFNSLIAYVFIAVFLFLSSSIFMAGFFYIGLCEMRGFFEYLPWILTIFSSALTMRLWAEERKTGSMALLLSLPLSEPELVVGKFIAALVFGIIAILSTFLIPIMLYKLGNPDPGPIIGGYIGSFLYLALLVSMGMFFSGLFEDQIVAFILTAISGLIVIFLSQESIVTLIEGWIPGLGLFLKKGLGAYYHFQPFTKGLIRYTDLLFFVSFTFVFVILNIFILKDWLRLRYRKTFYLLTLSLITSAIFFNAALADLSLGKLDLTENKLYTPSKVTKEIFSQLKDPLRVTYYVTLKDLPPFMRNMPRDIRDFFQELRNLSPYFSYKIVDPSDDPELIEYLKSKDIYPFTVKTVKKDEVSFKKIYSALEISYLDKPEQIIPQVVPSFLSVMEYELSSRVKKLLFPEPPVVALYVPKYKVKESLKKYWAEMGRIPPQEYDEYTQAKNLLKAEGFILKETKLNKEKPIPKDAMILLVFDPKDLTDNETSAVKKFIDKGKPVVIALQRYKFKYDWDKEGKLEIWAYGYPMEILKVLKDYGVGLSPYILADEQFVPVSIVKQKNVGGYSIPVSETLKIPIEIKILPYQMNKKLAFTKSLSGLLFLWGNSLVYFKDIWKKKGINGDTLFTSSYRSWYIPFRISRYRQKDFFPDNRTEYYGRKPLAVYLTDGKKLKLLVIGCSEMFTDKAIKAFGNAHFLVNIVNTLTLGEDLVYLRAKGGYQRYLLPVSDKEKILWRILITVAVPSIWLLLGLLRFAYRKTLRTRGVC